MSEGRWKRPHSVKVPTVWRRFGGRKPLVPGGPVPQFWVQDVTEDLLEEVIDHMTKFFLRDEPISKSTRLQQDERSTREVRDIWRDLVRTFRVSLVALTKDEGADKPRVVGANILAVYYKGEGYDNSKLKCLTARVAVRRRAEEAAGRPGRGIPHGGPLQDVLGGRVRVWRGSVRGPGVPRPRYRRAVAPDPPGPGSRRGSQADRHSLHGHPVADPRRPGGLRHCARRALRRVPGGRRGRLQEDPAGVRHICHEVHGLEAGIASITGRPTSSV